MWKVIKLSAYALICIYICLLLFPSMLFAKKIEYGNYTVYSDHELDGIEKILSDIDAAIVRNALYDPALKHQLFLGHGNRTFGFVHGVKWRVVSLVYGLEPALTYNNSIPPYFNHVVTFRIPDIAHNSLVHPERANSINMTQVLTHEIVHTYEKAARGWRLLSRPVLWKHEGYADYVAASLTTLQNPNYRIGASVEKILARDLSWMQDKDGHYTSMQYGCATQSFIKNEDGIYWPTCYFISRVLIEYLIDVEGHDLEHVMRETVTDTQTLNELISAYQAGKLE